MGRQVRKLLEGLVARNDLRGNVRFVLYSNNELPKDSLFDDELFIRRPVGMKAVFGSWAPSSFSLHYYVLLPLRVLIDSFRDGLSAMYYPNYMLPIIHPPHVRSLVMLTDDIFTESKNPALPFRYRLAYRIFATFWAKHRATRIMAISHSSAHALNHLGIARDRIVVNEMGVPAPLQRVPSAPRTDFLFVGQAFERRRLKESLLAFEQIAREHPDTTFRFIGKDKYPQPTIAKLIGRINSTLGRNAIISEEYVSDKDLAAAYRNTRSLVYVSDTEGFGMPPLEALSYGATPIVAHTPINDEIYDGNAFLVPEPYSVPEIERVMRQSLHDAAARERIVSAGSNIMQRYSWQAHADRFVDIMNTLTV